MPTPFSLAQTTKPSFSALAIIYCSLYKSGVMLDKVSLLQFFSPIFNKEMLLLFLVKFLKGF